MKTEEKKKVYVPGKKYFVHISGWFYTAYKMASRNHCTFIF